MIERLQNITAKYEELLEELTKSEVLQDYNLLRKLSKEKADLESVRDKIVDALVSKYLTNNQDAYIKSMQEVRKEYGMDIVDDDLSKNYTNYIQNSLLKIQENKNSSSSSSK